MTKNEPPPDKANKMTACPAKNQSSLSAWRKLGSLLPTERTAKTIIRLGGCPGLSESSLGAQSFCWFCREAAQICSLRLHPWQIKLITNVTDWYQCGQWWSRATKPQTFFVPVSNNGHPWSAAGGQWLTLLQKDKVRMQTVKSIHVTSKLFENKTFPWV